MSTESQQQIARQRSEHGVEYAKCEGCGDPIAGIIKTETGVTHEMCMKDAQPQRSEQESFRDAGYRGGKFKPEWRSEQQESRAMGVGDHLKRLIKTLADECLAEGKAINAALTAEREKLDEFYIAARLADKRELTAERQRFGVMERSFIEEQAQHEEERQRREQEQQGRNVYIQRLRDALGLKVGESLTQKAGEIYQQLLSALAAIEYLRNLKCTDGIVAESTIKRVLDPVDLSLLHERDAEVRKPLVDVINELLETSKDVAIGVFPTEAHLQARRKAVGLAKVKQ